jgi:hypothetical protein
MDVGDIILFTLFNVSYGSVCTVYLDTIKRFSPKLISEIAGQNLILRAISALEKAKIRDQDIQLFMIAYENLKRSLYFFV